ncbi:MAG TPA: hypothetical protein P5533_01540 [Candidatus Cloacimonadota bacterium]|nr:hypothetical protein [Candidatus Cloacimonadota bacterium]
MSSKRYLLSLTLLFLLALAFAQTSYWQNTDLSWRAGNPDSWGLKLYTGALATIDEESYCEVTNYLDWLSPPTLNLKQKLSNRFAIGYYSSGSALDYGIAYNATAFGGSEPIRINYEYVDGVPDILYAKELRHQASIDAAYRYSILEASGKLNLILLNTKPSQLWGDPISGIDQYLFDNYSRAELAVNPLPELRIHTAYDYKTHPMDEEIVGTTRDYNYDAIELGLAYDKKFNLNTHLSLQGTWQHRDWDAMQPEQRNQVITELRFGHHLNPYLYGYCSLINRSCFEDPSRDIYLLSNYARAQLQYRFPSDETSNSFVMLGVKIRPANDTAFHPDTSAYFAELNYAVLEGIYLGGRVNLAPEIQDEYRAKITLMLDQDTDLHLEYVGRQNRRAFAADPDLKSGIALGAGLHF